MSMVGFNTGRSEHKYLISEVTAQAMRGFVATYLALDEYMPANDPDGYQVHSLYLDSPGYDLYRETTSGIKNRYKLRMRFYDENPSSPVFLEIKSRTTESIRKMRAIVSKSSAEALLSGERLNQADLMNPNEKSILALEEFNRRVGRLSASGRVFVSYQREAYVALEADGIRVTFDRHIRGVPFDTLFGMQMPVGEVTVFPGQVVLEIKYTGQLPSWSRDLIRAFGLQRTSFPKYVHVVDALCRQPETGSPAMRGVAC
jgi:SPX domain protein involved in polyphosphate accumulation